MIVISSLGETDCKRSRFFRRSDKIFAQHVREGEPRRSHFVSLPILVAALASPKAADAAIFRILEARQQGQIFVDLRDLEETEETV